MDREILVVIVLVILVFLNIPIWLYLGKRFFGNWAGFCEALNHFSVSSLTAGLKGEFHDNIGEKFKFCAFFAICAFSFACEYAIVYLLIMGYGG